MKTRLAVCVMVVLLLMLQRPVHAEGGGKMHLDGDFTTDGFAGLVSAWDVQGTPWRGALHARLMGADGVTLAVAQGIREADGRYRFTCVWPQDVKECLLELVAEGMGDERSLVVCYRLDHAARSVTEEPSPAWLGADSESAPHTRVPAPQAVASTATQAAGMGRVLVVQDVTPWWGTNYNQELLNANGFPFDVVPASALATTDLSRYKVVILVGDQPQSCYDAWNAQQSALEAYVRGGGWLQVHAARGWQNGDPTSLRVPGAARVEWGGDGNQQVLLLQHPLVRGLQAGFWEGWGASFVTFLPGAAKAIIRNSAGPTLVEYPLGSGRVVLCTLFLEYREYGGLPAGTVLENMIRYDNPADAFVLPAALESGGPAGTTITYTLTLCNHSDGSTDFDLQLMGNAWPTTLWDAGQRTELHKSGVLAPSASVNLVVHVAIPAGTSAGRRDSVQVHATATANPSLQAGAVITTFVPNPILLVADDAGLGCASIYRMALYDNSLLHDLYTVPSGQCGPDLQRLRLYSQVIWFTGNQAYENGGAIQAADRDALVAYLQGGGRLLLSGAGLGRGLRNYARDFLRQYLGLDLYGQVWGTAQMAGVSGDPIGDGLTLQTGGQDGCAWVDNYVCYGDPILPGRTLFQYQGLAAATAVARYPYKTVFLGFDFSSLGGDATRAELLRRCVAWLGAPFPDYEVGVSPQARSGLGAPGTVVTYSITVRHNGQRSDDYALEVSGNAWPTSLWNVDLSAPLTQTGALTTGQTIGVVVKVEVPVGAEVGARDETQLVVSSTHGVSQTARLATAVATSFAQAYAQTGGAVDPTSDIEGYLDLVARGGRGNLALTQNDRDEYGFAVTNAPQERLALAWYRYGYNARGQSTSEVWFGLRDRDGQALVAEKQISDNSQSTQNATDYSPDLAVAPSGRIALTWERDVYDDSWSCSGANVWFALLSADGQSVITGTALTHGDELYCSSQHNAAPRYYEPSVAATNDNRFLVAWYSDEYTGTAEARGLVADIHYAVLDDAGNVVLPATRLTHDTPGTDDESWSPHLATLPGNRVLLTWVRQNVTWYAVLDSSGALVTAPAALSGGEGYDSSASAVALPAGGALVAWAKSTSSGSYVAYRRLDATYAPLGEVSILRNPWYALNARPSLTTDPEGRVVVAWCDEGAQRYLYYALLQPDGAVLTQPVESERAQLGMDGYLSVNSNGRALVHYAPLQGADLAVTLQPSQVSVQAGGSVTLTVGVSNNGGDAATATRLSLALPVELALVSDTSGHAPTHEGGQVIWDLGTVIFMGKAEFAVVLGTPENAAAFASWPVTLTASTTAADVQPANDSASGIVSSYPAYAAVAQWSAQAPASQFNQPGPMTIDPANGNLYVLDVGNSRVQGFAPDGTLLTMWGTYGTAEGQFIAPEGIAADGRGHVYVVDSPWSDLGVRALSPTRVQVFTVAGAFVRQWAGPASGPGLLGWVLDVATSPDGTLVYLADVRATGVHVFTPEGQFVKNVGNPAPGDGQFLAPQGLAVDDAGNLYISSYSNGWRVQELDPQGGYLQSFASPGGELGGFGTIADLAVGPDGRVYIGDAGRQRMWVFAADGSFVARWGDDDMFAGEAYFQLGGVAVSSAGLVYHDNAFGQIQVQDTAGTPVACWGETGSAAGSFDYAKGLARDAQGNVYVSDPNRYVVHVFDRQGKHLRQFRVKAVPIDGPWPGGSPYGLALDTDGHVYVCDSSNACVQVYDAQGAYVTHWGSRGPEAGQFTSPYGIALDAVRNRVYVTDQGSNTVQVFDRQGTYVALLAGPGQGNGQVQNPAGVAVSDDGTVYVADGPSRVQTFDSAGHWLRAWSKPWSDGSLGQMQSPDALAVDSGGRLFISDWNTGRVQVYTGFGDYLGLVCDTGYGRSANPLGLAVDERDRVYVAEASYYRVEVFDVAYPSTWRGEYYANRWLADAPVLIRDDAALDGDWSEGSPDAAVPNDNWSARWTKWERLEAGPYKFTVQADDGVRLWVDDRLLIEHWQGDGAFTQEASLLLSAGYHWLRVDYYDATGLAQMHVSWRHGVDVYLPLVTRGFSR